MSKVNSNQGSDAALMTYASSQAEQVGNSGTTSANTTGDTPPYVSTKELIRTYVDAAHALNGLPEAGQQIADLREICAPTMNQVSGSNLWSSQVQDYLNSSDQCKINEPNIDPLFATSPEELQRINDGYDRLLGMYVLHREGKLNLKDLDSGSLDVVSQFTHINGRSYV